MVNDMKNSKTQNNLSYPSLLNFNYEGFNFNYKDNKLSKHTQSFKEKLLKKVSENTLIIFNGEAIFNNLKNIEVTTEQNNNFTPETKLDQINKDNQNSFLNLKVTKNTTQKITVIISATKDLYHYSQVEIGENSNVEITNKFELTTNAKINAYFNSRILQNAGVQVISYQNLKNKKSNIINENYELCKNASLDYNLVNVNSANTINLINTKLTDEYANTQINTVNFANKTYRLVNLVKAEHLNKKTTSKINNFGLSNNSALLNIEGINSIKKGCIKSNASQNTKVINLTNEANSSANPQLLIDEHDVKASHSATIGKVDSKQLYYLMSRGLNKNKAIELIVMANVTNMLDKITNKKLLQTMLKTAKNKIL